MPVNLNLSQKCMAVLVPLVACYVGNLIDNQIRLGWFIFGTIYFVITVIIC